MDLSMKLWASTTSTVVYSLEPHAEVCNVCSWILKYKNLPILNSYATLACILGLHNCLEFSQLPSCLDEAM